MHALVQLVRTYFKRRESFSKRAYTYCRINQRLEGSDGDAVELKLFLELSLNALVRLIVHLQAGNQISFADLDILQEMVPDLIDCALSEIMSLLYSRCRFFFFIV